MGLRRSLGSVATAKRAATALGQADWHSRKVNRGRDDGRFGSWHFHSSTKRQKELSMQITRCYTTEGQDPFARFTFVARVSRIVNPDGSTVFEMKNVLAPEGWSQVAVDILAQKYFRRAGVPDKCERVAEAG